MSDLDNSKKQESVAVFDSAVFRAATKFFEKVVTAAACTMSVEVSLLYYVDRLTGSLRISHSYEKKLIGLRMASGLGCAGYCLQSKRTMVLNDTTGDSRVDSSVLADHVRLKNLMCTPVQLGDDIFGVLLVGNKTGIIGEPAPPAPFTSDDEKSLEYLAEACSYGYLLYNDHLSGSLPEESLCFLIRKMVGNVTAPQVSLFKVMESENYHDESLLKEGVDKSHKIDLTDMRLVHSSSTLSFSRSAKSISSSFFNLDSQDDEDGRRVDNASFARRPNARNCLSSSRTGAQLRLLTMSGESSEIEDVVSSLGKMYTNLMTCSSLMHLIAEAQGIAKEFTGANHSYVCSVSAENGGSLIISSASGDTILNLIDLPKELVTSLDWGIVTEVMATIQSPLSPSLGRLGSLVAKHKKIPRILPGVSGVTALIIPLLSPQEYDAMEAEETHTSEMSRLLILTKDRDRFSAFEKDGVSLFAKILSQAASAVSYRDSMNSNMMHVHRHVTMLDSFSNLSKPFVVLIGFDGLFLLGNRDLSDVFDGTPSGHFTSWIGSKNEQLLRDISNAIDHEKGVAREDYLLTTMAAEKGSGIALDYYILPIIDSYYNCHCMKCSSAGLVAGKTLSSRGLKALSLPCKRRLQGGSFIMLSARTCTKTLSDFRAYCRTPSSNPAGWFDDIDTVSRLSEGAKLSAFNELQRSASNHRNQAAILSSTRSAPNSPTLKGRGITRSTSDEFVDHLSPLLNSSSESMTDISSWNFHALQIKDKAQLKRVIFQIFSHSLDFSSLSIDSKVFADYVNAVSGLYREVIFHNFFHATCVTHATYMLLAETADVVTLPSALHFGLLLSALVHDIHHPGNTNLFEINCKSELAIMYNDQSVLENHHCATAFRLMSRPGLDVLGNMPPDTQKEVRKLMVATIMATDMSKHADLMEDTLVRANHQLTWNTNNLVEQIFYAKITLHAADLSNPIRRFDIAFEWAKLIAAEFNEQTKLETAAGLPVLSFMVSTDTTTIIKNELSFSTYVVAPMWMGLVKLFPNLNHHVKSLSDNASCYAELLAKESS